MNEQDGKFLSVDPVVETTATLNNGEKFTSSTLVASEPGEPIEYVVGTTFADQDGTLKVQFDDGTGNFDAEETKDYTASSNLGFRVPVVAPYYRVVYVNGATTQSTFRLNAWGMT